jgi:UDP-glucose 4-epimerase
MKIFLTGASGYLGSVLADSLAKVTDIESITGIDVVSPITPLPPKVKFVQMDIRSPDVVGLMAGHEVVVHTAFIVLWRAKMPEAERDDINLNGVRNVAKAAVANRIRRFIHTSSTAAYDPEIAMGKSDLTEDLPTGKGESFFYYANGKAAAEQTLTEVLGSSGICLTFFRPPYIVGPNNRETVIALRKNAVRIQGRNPRTQYVHEEDVASAFLQAARADMPGAYNIAPDDFIHVSDIYKIIGVESVRTLPLWLARLITDIRWRYFGLATHPSWVDALNADFTVSNAKLKGTGWRPRYSCAEALHSAL